MIDEERTKTFGAVSEIFPLSIEEVKEIIAKTFKNLTESMSFAKSWIEKFLDVSLRCYELSYN
ncbi:MAG TPA: hypothetical protein ENI32_02115 [Candidatus Syntrophoarchaeum butanivorans]|uniref:Transposase-like protein n=1 Tax=Candidatus Syntropharchaeum butanivorans TaxID=1839936 RepID=A0A1F2P771_9EURY|nr:MAG: Transposase-like protein [Candidatus Syntrophoarchaeum butanivorans]HEC56670.1 hypothetical protein [Candidatus Syntrophoarchaeum butanivorans]